MGKILLRGLLGIAPIAITAALLIWIYHELEYFFGIPLRYLIGPEYYFPGLGIIVAIIVLFLLGLVLNYWVIQSLYNWIEGKLKRIPLIKTIYTSVTDLMSFFRAGQKKESGKVVKIEIDGISFIGLVTRNTFDDLPDSVGSNDDVAVFIPFSYQIGGFTAIVPKSKLKPVDLSVERAIRFAVTAASPSADKSTFNPTRKSKKS